MKVNIKHITVGLATVLLLVIVSCSKNPTNNTSENTNREQPAQPEGFTIDTTWSEGINVPF